MKHIKETTTLSTLDKHVTCKKFTYHPLAHNEFNKLFKHYNIVLMQQNNTPLEIFINCNLKDHITPEKKSATCQIICKDWRKMYI